MAVHMLPYLFRDKGEMTLYHIDNNNKIDYKTKNFKIKQFRINQTNDAIDEVELNSLVDENKINIIDAGGGDDTKRVLKALSEAMVPVKFIIPIDQNLQSRTNLSQTIEEISTRFPNPEIYVVLSRIFNKNEIKKEFISIYGNETFGVSAIDADTLQKIKDFGFMPFWSVLQIFDAQKTALLDKFLSIEELIKDKDKLIKEFVEKLKQDNNEEMTEKYKKFKQTLREAEEIYKYSKNLDKINKNFVTKINERD
ncbi:hypothetical protein C6V80_09955 (plasmid) [Caminibacter pacificus]|uniref:Uncharacterized protein n=1 Tax=Caminibacter pacificus TaxID=1424653 RepID=A0ABX5VWV3_9BACT|nr:hypothetical protein C6V80_09955 [Caminibacter pacificus]